MAGKIDTNSRDEILSLHASAYGLGVTFCLPGLALPESRFLIWTGQSVIESKRRGATLGISGK